MLDLIKNNIQQIKEKISFSDNMEATKQFISNWSGKAIVWIRALPDQMQGDANQAAAVFFVANAVLAGFSEMTVKLVDYYLTRNPNELSAPQKSFKDKFSYALFAGCIYGGNRVISHLTNYTLQPRVLAAVTLGMTFLRYIARNTPFSSSEANTKTNTNTSPNSTRPTSPSDEKKDDNISNELPILRDSTNKKNQNNNPYSKYKISEDILGDVDTNSLKSDNSLTSVELVPFGKNSPKDSDSTKSLSAPHSPVSSHPSPILDENKQQAEELETQKEDKDSAPHFSNPLTSSPIVVDENEKKQRLAEQNNVFDASYLATPEKREDNIATPPKGDLTMFFDDLEEKVCNSKEDNKSASKLEGAPSETEEEKKTEA